MDKRPIGVFDSGVGGLTVLKALIEKMPNENFIYFGDSARMPYGEKTADEIKNYTEEAINFFIGFNVKAVVIACNTATCCALQYVKSKFEIPIFGVIEPGVSAVINEMRNTYIVNLATSATIKNGMYETLLKKYLPNSKVVGIACPELVLDVELNRVDTIDCTKHIDAIMNKADYKKIDCLILGCTHFPVLEKKIIDFKNKNNCDFKIINPADETSKEIEYFLTVFNMKNNEDENGSIICYTSGNLNNFSELSKKILGRKCVEIYSAKLR